MGEGSLARLSAHYTQARHLNAGIERLHEEVSEDMAGEVVSSSEVVVNEVSEAIRDP